MNSDAIIEQALEGALAKAEANDAPASLVSAMRYAVFPGGARVRPQLCLAVADACGGEAHMALAAQAGTAIELFHCASLVHDDLPAFDGANTRRGKPSVHMAFSEPLAVLCGDALIVLAFQSLFHDESVDAEKAVRLHRVLGAAVGAPYGIVAGQAWESEPHVNLRTYHRSKTGALFVAAVMAGAVCAGESPDLWRPVGSRLGEAYQIADDLLDHVMDSEALGKPAGQDSLHGRPNAVAILGVQGTLDQLNALIQDAADAVPACEKAGALRDIVFAQARRLTPKQLLNNAT